MGSMKNLDIDRMNLERQFIDWLADLFSEKEYKIIKDNGGLGRGPDLEIGADESLILVELKIHRSRQLARRLLRNALYQLANYMRIADASEGILIVTQPLDREQLDVPVGITIWDLPELVRQAQPYPHLAIELSELQRALQVGAEPAREESSRPSEHDIETIQVAASEEADPAAGAAIIARLEALQPGKTDATRFEKACEDALRLMFGTEFVGWRPQNWVDGGFHRMDLIARLVPTQNPFWSGLASDFRTRYVIFEFKNYTDPISHDQIYTTEKYLFTTALRSVAIIVAYNGASDSAQRAARGSLREQGKLILCISRDELYSMLSKRDGGGDPTDLLYERLDEMLMTIAR